MCFTLKVHLKELSVIGDSDISHYIVRKNESLALSAELFFDLNLLAKNLNNEISPACNFDSGDHTHLWAMPFFRFCAPTECCISVQEGRRDFFHTAK